VYSGAYSLLCILLQTPTRKPLLYIGCARFTRAFNTHPRYELITRKHCQWREMEIDLLSSGVV
jgi:hypothetical protein